MKAIITYLLTLSALPIASSAQPVLTKNEFYYNGEVVQMVNCDPSTVVAGASGANVTWDFSGLIASGGMSVTTILNDTSVIFNSSNLMEYLPDGTIAFVKENNTDSYINGIYDTSSHVTTGYSQRDDSKRSFTYNSNYVDTYRVTIPSVTVGTGRLFEIGDSYGTLILPTGTYTNVLRIKKVQAEYDTTGAAASVIVTTSYLWFDTSHIPPLLRIDSVVSNTTESQQVMYLSPSELAANVTLAQADYNGYLDNNEHLIVNGFESGKNYEVILYNVIGNKVFSEDFTAGNLSRSFDIGRQLAPGIYIARIMQKDEPYGAAAIKLIKQG